MFGQRIKKKVRGKTLPRDEHCGCGIGILSLPKNYWGTPACLLHDAIFDWHNDAFEPEDYAGYFYPPHGFKIDYPEASIPNRIWVLHGHTRKEADDIFLSALQWMANSEIKKLIQAKTLYRIARIFGGLWWR